VTGTAGSWEELLDSTQLHEITLLAAVIAAVRYLDHQLSAEEVDEILSRVCPDEPVPPRRT
jgi:hypothetical protein